MVTKRLCQEHREIKLSILATTQYLAASGDEGGFHAPSVSEFFPAAIFEFGSVEFNRIHLARIIAAVVLVVLFMLAAKRAKLVPSRGQNIAEMALDFVRVNIAEEILGHNARKYLPMLTTMFFAILAFNITGIVPFLNIASTSLVAMPIVLALWTFFVYLTSGMRKFGVGTYLKNQLFPPGMPVFLYILITPIEALQVFLFRPLTLALRLTANMVAGHLLLVLCFGAANFFLLHPSFGMKALAPVGLAAGLAFTLFEILVAALQAYVFTLLSAVYINMAIEEEH